MTRRDRATPHGGRRAFALASSPTSTDDPTVWIGGPDSFEAVHQTDDRSSVWFGALAAGTCNFWYRVGRLPRAVQRRDGRRTALFPVVMAGRYGSRLGIRGLDRLRHDRHDPPILVVAAVVRRLGDDEPVAALAGRRPVNHRRARVAAQRAPHRRAATPSAASLFGAAQLTYWSIDPPAGAPRRVRGRAGGVAFASLLLCWAVATE